MKIERWIAHFAKNGRNRREPDWQAPMLLGGERLVKLTKSIQQFQLGDGGGPAYLIAWNRKDLLDDSGMKRLVDLWFKEEREHSRLLGAALKRLGGTEIQSHWSFGLFCGLRKFLGVRFELAALLGTEIVSHVYYKMLRNHVGDTAIREMCDLIVRDEAGHIAFHRDRLASGGRRFGKWWEAVFRVRGVLAGTVLWVNHRGALISLGGSDAEFYRRIWRDMGVFIKALRREAARASRAPGAMKAASLRDIVHS